MTRFNRTRVFNVLLIVALIGIVAPFAVYSMPGLVGADQSFVVLSGSMEPAISPGDVVVVADAPASRIGEGDVITFARPGVDTPTTHRVVEVSESEVGEVYTTKGDANEDPDAQPIQESQVVGKVTFVLPFVGYVIQFVNTQVGFAALVVLPLGLLVLSEAWSIARSGDDADAPRASDDAVAQTETPVAPTSPESEAAPRDADVAGVTTGSSGTTTGAEAPQPRGAGVDTETDDQDAAITVTRSDLRLTLVVLGLFAAYAVWMAVQDLTGLTVTVAVATTAGVLIGAAAFVAAGGDPESDPSSSNHESIESEPSPDGEVSSSSADSDTTPQSTDAATAEGPMDTELGGESE